MSAPQNFSWISETKIAGLAQPTNPDQVRYLANNNIGLVVSLTEDTLPQELFSGLSVENLHLPVPDFTAPTLLQVEQFIQKTKQVNEANLGVAVHCKGGIGRTGTLLACWLVAQGESAEEAIAHVRELRPRSVETKDQEDLVKRYQESLKI